VKLEDVPLDNQGGVIFFRPKGGKVHIFAGKWSTFDTLGETPQTNAEIMTAAMFSRNVGLCGAKGGIAACDYTDCFDDDDLCIRCRDIFPDEHSEMLFQHQQTPCEPRP